MAKFNSIAPSVDGWEEANEFLSALYAGAVSIQAAQQWTAELRREGLVELAEEIERRLPPQH